MLLLENPEIIFNFWYVHDEQGFIYSLRARAYVGVGTDEEKVATLRDFAEIDYVIVRPYKIPERFYIEIQENAERKKMPVTHVKILPQLDSPIALFEDAIKDIEANLPAQTKYEVSQNPIMCITPLLGDDDGEIESNFKEV